MAIPVAKFDFVEARAACERLEGDPARRDGEASAGTETPSPRGRGKARRRQERRKGRHAATVPRRATARQRRTKTPRRAVAGRFPGPGPQGGAIPDGLL